MAFPWRLKAKTFIYYFMIPIRFLLYIDVRTVALTCRRLNMSKDCSGAHSGELFGVQFLYMGLDHLRVIDQKTNEVCFIRAEYFLRMEVGRCVFVAPFYSEYVHSGLHERDLAFIEAFMKDDSVVWYVVYPGVEDGQILPLPTYVNPSGDNLID